MNTAIILEILFLFASMSVAPSSRQESDDDIVATVSGVEILRSNIAVPSEEARFRYKLKTGQPSEAGQEGEIEELRQQLEIRRLATEIRRIVVGRTKARLGVSATEAEVLGRWRELTLGVDFDAVARQQSDSIAPLLAALKAVHEQGKDARKVYDTFLFDRMTLQEWEVQARYYRTPGRRRALERALEETGDDLSNPDAGVRAMVEGEKLGEAIDAEIAKDDPSFAEYLELRGSNVIGEQQGEYPPYYLEGTRAKWWSEQYRDANIEILDERYNEVLHLLVQSTR